jgi:putative ABC transport system substrate-binding protein
MRKAGVLSILFVVVLLAVAVIAEAQQRAKVPKIEFLGTRPAAASGERLWRELRELGHIEGKTIAIEFRYADNKLDRLPALADELVRLKVDVFVTPGISEALAAKNATKTIPIVFYEVGADPVAIGLVDSLARPGGNITGFTNITALLVGKRLELLKETIPKLSRVAVLWDPQNPGSAQQWQESLLSARELGLQLHSIEVSSADNSRAASKRQLRYIALLSP